MTAQLTLSVPSTLTVLGGTGNFSSLDGLGPQISLTGARAGDTLSLQITAANAGAVIGIGNSGGATLVNSNNSLSLTGTQAQIDMALFSLQLIEPAGAAADTLVISATDSAAAGVSGNLLVDVAAPIGPAFAAPPVSMTAQPNSLTNLSGLVLSDPAAEGLAAMGLGKEETLSLTLSVNEGVLFLPGYSAMSGMAVSGLGSGTIELTLTADEIAALNTLLAGLEYLGPASDQQLNYDLFNMAGVLPVSVTHGGLTITTAGTAGAGGSFALGTQSLVTTGETFSGTLSVASGVESFLGNLAGGSVEIAPGAVLETPYGNMALSGSSADFGTLFADEMSLTGTMLAGGGMTLLNGLTMAASSRLDFTNGLTLYSTANNSLDVGLNMGSGAIMQGNGTLKVGNFSQGGVIEGGTLQALGGETLEIDASWVTSDALLQVGGGGVMVLGPVSSLYGVFTTPPLMVNAGVTLNFAGAGSGGITGGYASTLGGTGGAFIISEPQDFYGTITGFTVGDALIFPDLASISIYNIGSSSFQMAGLDLFGNTVTYTVHTSIASGLAPAVGKDAQGDEEIFMRATAASVTQGGALAAAAGVPQPLLGVSINAAASGTQNMALTLTATQGSLSSGGGSFASSITLTGNSVDAINASLAGVEYLGTGAAASVVFSSNTGVLAGIQGGIIVEPGGAGVVSAYSGAGLTAAEMVSYGPIGGYEQVTQALDVAEVAVSGAADFENILRAGGYAGTGLLVDGGGEALFGPAATVSLGGNVTLGDASGAGTLVVEGQDFSVSGNVLLAPVVGGAGSVADIAGTLSASGALEIGGGGAAALVLEGGLSATALSLGNAGTLEALGTWRAGFGAITNSGTLLLNGEGMAGASAYQGGGALELGGADTLAVAGAYVAGGDVSIGAGAALTVASFTESGSSFYNAGMLSGIALNLNDGTLAGGTLQAASINFDGTVTGAGVVDAPSITVFGTLEAAGGRLVLSGNVDNGAALGIGQGAILEIGGTVGNAPVNFEGIDGDLLLDNAAGGSFNVAQMTLGDAIDLAGIAPSLVSVPASSGGTGYILNTQGNTIEQFGIVLSDPAQHISLVSDGHGGSLITVDGVLPCFARGTGILGPQGYRPVESLRPNDPVITARGERRPVRWIGWRTLDLGPGAARPARPVLIMPNAFGPGRPQKVLRLSPSHCVYMDGMLIPVTHLVNGATILHEAGAQAATYFHIELDRHDILLADGLACESYFDDGNRAAMYQELGRRSPARRPFAPVVTHGARLVAARRALHNVAEQAGFTPRFQPALRGVVAGEVVLPEIVPAKAGRVAHFTFPHPAREMVLFSATSCPADTDPDSDDRRELGICLGMPGRGVHLGAGWQARAAGDAGTWMGASAMLGFTRARREISLPLAAISCRWHREMVDGRRRGG